MACFIDVAAQVRRPEVQLDRPCAELTGHIGKAGGRVDLPARANDGEQRTTRRQGCFDLLHVQRHLAEPNDVRPQRVLAAGSAARIGEPGTGERRHCATTETASFREFPVHVQQVGLPGSVVQVVNILSYDEDGAGILAGEASESVVRSVRLDGRVLELLAPGVVERVDPDGIAGERVRGGNVFDAHVCPESVGGRERWQGRSRG